MRLMRTSKLASFTVTTAIVLVMAMVAVITLEARLQRWQQVLAKATEIEAMAEALLALEASVQLSGGNGGHKG